MCTLTYRLTEEGYQVFFNRDEQITRSQAISPEINALLKAAYPIDPTGGGTWIAVHENGTSLALLNYYQAQIDPSLKNFTSRGVIIPYLLTVIDDIQNELMKMDLSVFQAFQLCVFESNLSEKTKMESLASQYIWDGKKLTTSIISVCSSLPITSSGVDYETVSAYRKQQFNLMLGSGKGTADDFIAYHQQQGNSGKCSVKMCREDAQTVSLTQISVNQQLPLGAKISVSYLDYLNDGTNTPQLLTL